ncbi:MULTISPECIES: tryptophan 2,3-dioxygenase [unclassified Nocardioides]|uniref:tryptophan 2,3-dioxygenase n=1 Tax=unclassified Nocardioides TaxID=2615069 RepID=UPI0006FE4C34|nr:MULTISPECIES: tryptophan 2,3-dioxygenase family protein [unclassified Nocardioides]KRA29531.1 tryptophan 2,3-dioxygenase [Nocardioides sp. Root614]KRA88294.1 tryptophan 2,3-dioxygenase [Nocardioides sp. Root682]
MNEPHPSLTYSHYLALDEVLAAQRPRSDEHDELLFIVIHQVYELWFKQMLHELTGLQRRLEDGDTPRALHTLGRVLAILKVAVAQVDVLETMTPRQFTSFRGRLDASSGFQSEQFRELEATLGRRDRRVFEHYPEGSAGRERIATAMSRPSVFDSYLRYLVTQGYDVPPVALDRDLSTPWEPSPEVQTLLLAAYAEDGGSAQVAERLVDLDEGLQEWRYRHVKMVERTIGAKMGTGGSSGATYLWSTVTHQLFPDLWAIRSEM